VAKKGKRQGWVWRVFDKVVVGGIAAAVWKWVFGTPVRDV
jgi:hypothetical protein